MLFSQRKGLKPVQKAFQTDSMDDDLRNGLWNALTLYCWKHNEGQYYSRGDDKLTLRLWLDFFKFPLDDLSYHWYETRKFIRNTFYKYSWNEVYDFIEFIANNIEADYTSKQFQLYCNVLLERECSSYRFVSGKITELTSEEEIAAIEEALEKSSPLSGVNTHLKIALGLMSDRKSPDYRNSIKESISAVNALANLITNEPKASLGKALDLIETKSGIKLHGALKGAFDKLYGYTSDADGIRHALLKESTLLFSDAKYMLVTCSAFINYLLDKAEKAGIKISK